MEIESAAAAPAQPARLDERLNRECFCITVDQAALWDSIAAATPGEALRTALMESREHLFSSRPVFLSRSDVAAMSEVVTAIEAAATLESYRAEVLARAPDIARHDFGPRGAFMGYDFHLGPDGPRLIEVNTNAGGAFLNALLARAQLACCAEVQTAIDAPLLDGFEDAVWRMFETEWRRQGRAGAPGFVAIVDDRPKEQYLYPEFLLAQAFFESRGVKAIIVDPAELDYSGGALRHNGETVDLVYNRLVDFALEEPAHSALRLAYESGATVVTPNPHNHALLADKRNLTLLSDPERLAAWGLEEARLAALSHVPRTAPVTALAAEELWARRKSLFFKPAGGYGGKAVYRGDKLTRTVWAAILQGDYIAQELAAPSERLIDLDGEVQARKLDVRLYTYAGETLLAAARLYQGQTTNFRTPGGGFAPVIVV
jgi:hypothetical protein